MTTANEIKVGIMGLDDINDLNEIQRIVRERIQRVAKQGIRIGSKVRFHTKNRGSYEGAVVKINPKTVKVDVGGGQTWRVGPTLLELID